MYFDSNGCTYFHSGNTGRTNGFVFRNTAQGDILTINDNGNITSSGTFTNNQFSTSSYNQIVLKSITVYPYVYGSGGYYLIDVHDYATQGTCYLQLSLNSTDFYWLGRVYVSSTVAYFINDWYSSCGTSYVFMSGRLNIVITPFSAPAQYHAMSSYYWIKILLLYL